jgi:hypothetical protein
LVLASIDFMDQLANSRKSGETDPQSVEKLLELVDSMVIVTDHRLCVTGMSPPARHHFSRSDWRGQSLSDLLPETMRAILMRSVHHVCETKLTDSFQLRIGPNADRRIDVTVQPYGGGVCIVGRDRTASDARRDVATLSDAVRQTLQLLGNVAVMRINLRGFIIRASESFETLSGLAPEVFSSVRVPTLFDVATRMAVSDALEQTIEQASPQLVTARLMVNRGDPVNVRIAFSAEMLRSSIDAVIATVAPNV